MNDADLLKILPPCLPMLAAERMFNLAHYLMSVREVPGDICEFGVYKGYTALFMAALSPAKQLYLYDSFEGLPEPQDGDTNNPGSFFTGAMKGDPAGVLKLFEIAGVPEPTIVNRLFERVMPDHLPDRIAFAHIDCDLSQSIHDALYLAWPMVSPGGILLIDDYGHPELIGVKPAVDKFFHGMVPVHVCPGRTGPAWACWVQKEP